ncbi:Oligopeptide transport system permease protein OppB [Piscirickettsia salmonis]|uniref:oligopeptide ABC transporter permease OppB n=1 Tax=Piscirickettsia salmonis TaxID=1238 RepID=UPI0012B8E7B6|nr:oligopeptide ABC transporter permease OppB [Piscirickettsia salmonis]QGO65736.1 Oligopeptide transport system permease protein OppB [Piscirickettsia salmonis]
MFLYIIKRICGAIPTLLILVTICFFMMRLAPGGPFDGERALPPQVKENLLKAYHLNEPVYKQYFIYLNNLAHGELGPSYKYRDWTVNQLVAKGFPVSLKLGLWAMFWAVLLGIILGSIAALRQNSWIDYLVMSFSMFGISIPNFVVAPVMVLIFAISLKWLPAGTWGEGHFSHLLLPVIALAIPQLAIIARIMRGSMIEVLSSNFIRTAKSKGLSSFTIVTRHALKPALMPVISYLGPAMAAVITGSVVVEQIFGLPGIGTLLVQAATAASHGVLSTG